jgi:hypothetical protein
VRGFPIASNVAKLVELHRAGEVKLDPEVIAAQETVERTDAIAASVAQRAQTARDRASAIESGIPAKVVEATRTGKNPEDTIAELEEAEAEARRADRLLLHVTEAAERARDELASHAHTDEIWRAMDEALQVRVLDKATKALEKVPADVSGFEDLRRRDLSGSALSKARDALNELEDAYALYGTLRRLAESLAVLCYSSDGQVGRLPGDALDRLVFSFRTGYRLINHNQPRWPESGTPLMRYIVENRDELGPWIPHGEDSWRGACAAALAEIVPPEVAAQREAWAGTWR